MSAVVTGPVNPSPHPQALKELEWRHVAAFVGDWPALRRALEEPVEQVWDERQAWLEHGVRMQSFGGQVSTVDAPPGFRGELVAQERRHALERMLQSIDLSMEYGESAPPGPHGRHATMAGRHEQLGIEIEWEKPGRVPVRRPILDVGRVLVLRPIKLMGWPGSFDGREWWSCSLAVKWEATDGVA